MQGQQVLLGVVCRSAACVDTVNLETNKAPTQLAAPRIALWHVPTERLIEFRLDLRSRPFWAKRHHKPFGPALGIPASKESGAVGQGGSVGSLHPLSNHRSAGILPGFARIPRAKKRPILFTFGKWESRLGVLFMWTPAVPEKTSQVPACLYRRWQGCAVWGPSLQQGDLTRESPIRTIGLICSTAQNTEEE